MKEAYQDSVNCKINCPFCKPSTRMLWWSIAISSSRKVEGMLPSSAERAQKWLRNPLRLCYSVLRLELRLGMLVAVCLLESRASQPGRA